MKTGPPEEKPLLAPIMDEVCDECHTPLVPVIKTPQTTQPYQFEGAGHLTITGGYGEFWDVDLGPPGRFVLCKDCCIKFCNTFPGIAAIMKMGW